MTRSKGKNKQTRLLRLVVIVLFAVCLWQGHLVFIDFEGPAHPPHVFLLAHAPQISQSHVSQSHASHDPLI